MKAPLCLGSAAVLVAIVNAAPAPQVVTIYQTATEVTNSDGSVYTVIPPSSDDDGTEADVVVSVTTTATSAASTATSTGFNLDSLLSSGKISEWWSFFKDTLDDDDDTLSDTSTATTTAATTTKGGFLKGLLGLLKGDSTSTSTSTTAESTATTSAVARVAASATSTSDLFDFLDDTSSTTSTSTTAKTSFTKTSTSQSTSTSTDGIYDAIADSDDIDEDFARDTLDAHNQYRADHGVGALSWDVDAYNYAKNDADNYDCSGILTHTHGEFGENLAAGFKNGPAAVKAWYDEGETYDYSAANTFDHFTQVVWKSTTKVGCAYKDCTSTGWGLYIVCEYDPPGNVIGYSSENVLPLVD